MWQSLADTIKCPAYICRAQAVNPRLRFVCNFSLFKNVKCPKQLHPAPCIYPNKIAQSFSSGLDPLFYYMPNIGMHITFFVLQKKKKEIYIFFDHF